MITCWHSVWLLQPSSHDDLLTECPSVTAIIQWLSADRLSNCYTIIPWLSADWVSDWYAIISWLSADRVSNCYSHHSTMICWPSVQLLQPLSHDYLLTECLTVTAIIPWLFVDLVSTLLQPLSQDYLLSECLTVTPVSHDYLLTECLTVKVRIQHLCTVRASIPCFSACWPSVCSVTAIIPRFCVCPRCYTQTVLLGILHSDFQNFCICPAKFARKFGLCCTNETKTKLMLTDKEM